MLSSRALLMDKTLEGKLKNGLLGPQLGSWENG